MKEKNTKISRENFAVILAEYLDGKLGKKEAAELKSFLINNPELTEHFPDWNSNSDFSETAFTSDFGYLKKGVHTDADHKTWEEWQIDHLEGNLNEEEQSYFSNLLETHQTLKKEASLFSLTILESNEDIMFPDKKILYKKELKPGKIISLKKIILLRVAAAILAILTISGYLISILPTKEKFTDRTQKRSISDSRNYSEKTKTAVTAVLAEKKHVSPTMIETESTRKPLIGVKIKPIPRLSLKKIEPDENYFIEPKRYHNTVSEYLPDGIPVISTIEESKSNNDRANQFRDLINLAQVWLLEDSTAFEVDSPSQSNHLTKITIMKLGFGLINKISGSDIRLREINKGETSKMVLESKEFSLRWVPK